MTLALPARAKLNLDLEIIRRRGDGFHDIRTTFQAVELHDLLEITPAAETVLTTSGLTLSTGNNAILKAQHALEQAARRPLPARIHLHKRIPPGSGMGGASSDAAATLRGLSLGYQIDLDLAQVAEQIGADVPFFFAGGRARGEGRGERLTPLQTQLAWFAIAWPGIELLTADVYRAWDDVKGDGPNHLRRAAEHIAPRLRAFAHRLDDSWQMTGSGSAFFKPCTTRTEAEKAAARIDGWTTVTCAIGT